jgi:hypothetical protein
MFLKTIFTLCLVLFLISKGKSESDSLYFSSKNFPSRIYTLPQHKALAEELKSYLELILEKPFTVSTKLSKNYSNGIFLFTEPELFFQREDYFAIFSNAYTISLIAKDSEKLEYAIYTFLEELGMKMFIPDQPYYPKKAEIKFSKIFKKFYLPSFEYRAILYPGAYSESFRKWHKLDWQEDDFGIWGHSFDKLVPPKKYFQSHPDYFAYYEEERRAESLCMTDEEGFSLASVSLDSLIQINPNAKFYSISQNDDVVFCECEKCHQLNAEHRSPAGSLYHYLNKHAINHPEKDFISLAYLHTAEPPKGISPEPNLISFYCPIEMNRGMSIGTDQRSGSFRSRIQTWKELNPRLYLWDYTVQFTNYLSPFPNIHTFRDNLLFYKENGVLGLFLQGFADVPGDFVELRQYLLSKLLWDTDQDVERLTEEFVKYYFGPAYPYVLEYLKLLQKAQESKNQFLDIYSGPVQKVNDFLSPYWMDKYDQIIILAENAVEGKPIFIQRVNKIRLGLEYVYFEQSKYYGKDRMGMFRLLDGKWAVPENLTKRVEEFVKICEEMGIYELSEGGLSPLEYLEEWMNITNNSLVTNKGEGLDGYWESSPAPEYQAKGFSALIDGLYAPNDFNIGWTGWYDNDAIIIFQTANLVVNTIEISFLNDQRHWIFPPKSISIEGLINGKWKLIKTEFLPELEEDFTIKSVRLQLVLENLNKFESIKISIKNQDRVPKWRYRRGKKPLLMIDEILFK